MYAVKRLVIIRGVSGSGKSTMAIKAFKNKGYVHIETDHFFYIDGEYKFDQAKLTEAWAWAHRKMQIALEQGKNVVMSNTYTRHWEIKDTLEKAGLPMKDVMVIHAHGGVGNDKGIPEFVIEKMTARWEPWNGEKKLMILPETLGTPCVKLINYVEPPKKPETKPEVTTVKHPRKFKFKPRTK